MEMFEEKEDVSYPVVGVLYQEKTSTLESLYKNFKNKFIFTSDLDQFSFFLCDKFIIEDESILVLWRDHVESVSLKKIEEIKTLISGENKTSEKKYYFVKKSLLQNFKSSPVNLYSSLSSGGKSHYRKVKDKGLYIPRDNYKDSLVESNDLGIFFRNSCDYLIRFSKRKEFKKFIELAVSLLTFCRENLVINENPIYLFGLKLCIKKSMGLLCEKSSLLNEFIQTVKSGVTPENQLDMEALFHCFICQISNLPSEITLSSLFLNSLFSNKDLALINSKFDLDEMVSLASKDKELVLNHAFIMAHRFRGLKLGSDAFYHAILQHHGAVNGKGFSDTFRSSISKINICFIAAHKLSQLYLELRPSEPIEHAVSSLKESIQFLPLKTEIEKLFNEHKKLFSNR